MEKKDDIAIEEGNEPDDKKAIMYLYHMQSTLATIE